MTAKDTTQTVLAELTAGIMGRHEDKSKGLTPLGLETGATPKQQFAPMESPYQLAPVLARIRDNMVQLDKYVSAIETDVKIIEGRRTETIIPIEPDLPFEAQFAKLQKEAQASAFTDADEPAPITDWACPTHKSEDVRLLTSRRGRTYGSCAVTACKEFEK